MERGHYNNGLGSSPTVKEGSALGHQELSC